MVFAYDAHPPTAPFATILRVYPARTQIPPQSLQYHCFSLHFVLNLLPN